MNKFDSKNTTKILTLVSIIEKRDSGQNHNSSRVFCPELVNYNFLKAQLQS